MSADVVSVTPIVVPLAGGSYVDPAFGTTVTRITATGSWCAPDYSTFCPFNADQSRYLLVNVDHFVLMGGTSPVDLPIGASCDPRLSRTDPGLIYFVQGNALNSLEVGTGRAATVRSFPEYTDIRVGNGEGDISFDGGFFALVGTRPGGGVEIFVYDIKANVKGAAFDTAGRPLDAVYMAPSGVLVKWTDAIELRDIYMGLLRPILSCDGHGAVGPDNCLYVTNSNESPVTLPDFPNGIVRIDLATGKQTGLLALPWGGWEEAVDIAANVPGLILVATYSARGGDWVPYRDELLLCATDGSFVKRLAHTRTSADLSWPTEDRYLVQPHAQFTQDPATGKIRVIWGSNMAHPSEPGRCDTYMLEADSAASEGRRGKPRSRSKGRIQGIKMSDSGIEMR